MITAPQDPSDRVSFFDTTGTEFALGKPLGNEPLAIPATTLTSEAVISLATNAAELSGTWELAMAFVA